MTQGKYVGIFEKNLRIFEHFFALQWPLVSIAAYSAQAATITESLTFFTKTWAWRIKYVILLQSLENSFYKHIGHFIFRKEALTMPALR